MNRIDICKNIIQSIKEYITTPEKLEPHRAKNHFVRKRKLSLFQVIMYLLYTSKASMFQNLSRIREDLGNLDFPDISKQALSKARQFINPALFKELYYLSVNLFYKQLPSRKLWNGYHLFAIDGSKIELPNSKSNFEFFGEMFGYPDPNRRFTMGLGSIVYDVLDDYIVHASFQRYLASERSAALEHLHNLEDLNIYQNSVVIFDRGYYSEDMFRYCVEHQHLCLMRLKQNYNIAKKFCLFTELLCRRLSAVRMVVRGCYDTPDSFCVCDLKHLLRLGKVFCPVIDSRQNVAMHIYVTFFHLVVTPLFSAFLSVSYKLE